MILFTSALRVLACFVCVYKYLCVSICVNSRVLGCRCVCVYLRVCFVCK